jgi:hypothetical protein
VLCVAGTAKLRAPDPARRALLTLGLPSGRAIVRAVGLCELGVGGWCAIDPSRASAAAIAVIYAVFAVIASVLARRQVSCGCFGGEDRPASIGQALLSAAISLVAVGEALAGPHGLAWVLGRPAAQAAVLLIGASASTCAAVLAYTEFPRAWGAWSAR